jgi:hypothetical protein
MSEHLTKWLAATRDDNKYNKYDITVFEELLNGTLTVQEAAARLSKPSPTQRLLHTNHKVEDIWDLFP